MENFEKNERKIDLLHFDYDQNYFAIHNFKIKFFNDHEKHHLHLKFSNVLNYFPTIFNIINNKSDLFLLL